MSKPELVLYIRSTCPFCHKVLNYLKSHDLEVKTKDISNQLHQDHLIKVGGKSQVPCLFIDNKPLYESSDIIAYFRKNN